MKNYTKLKFALIVGFITSFSFLLSGCFNSPKDFVAPSYNIKLSIPIADSTYTIDDFLGNDTTLTASTDPNILGVLFYHQTDDITTFTVSDNLKIDDFSSSTSQSIGSVKIDNVTPIVTNIALSDWTPFSGGQTVVVPALPSASSTQDFTTISQFESAVFETGILTLTFTSNLPIENDINSLIIRNKADGSIVIQSSTVIVIPANGSNQVTYDLAGITFKNQVEIEVLMSSPGSGGNSVTFPQNSGTDITADIGSFTLSSTTAILPAQDDFDVTDVVSIDDSTKVEIVKFDAGVFNVKFNNNLDLDININLQINNLKKPDGTVYSKTVSLGRKEQNKNVSISSMKDWSIVTLTPGTPTNNLNYTATVSVPGTSDARTLKKEDNVTVDVSVTNLKINYVTGQIKLTSFNIDQTEFNIDLGDIKTKFTFDSLNVNDPQITLHLNSSVGIGVSFNGTILGRNNTDERSLSINSVISANSNQVFDLRNYGLKDFINGFHTSFPSSFTFTGSGIVNPDYVIGSVSKDDSVSGFIDTQLPLDIGIAGGTFRDTTTIDTIEISDSDINGINSVFVTLNIENKIPAKISAKATILDKNTKVPLFDIPASYNSISEIIINPAEVDNNGFAIAAASTIQTIELKGEDARSFIRNRTIAFNLTLLTPPEGSNAPVKFRNTDQIKVRISGSIDFKLNNN